MKNPSQILKYFQIFFYVAFELLWFKHNFPALARIPISSLIPLLLLVLCTLARASIRYYKQKPRLRFKFLRSYKILFILLFVAVCFRIPFLANVQGINDGDDGLIILQAKHIAEGEAPSIYNYGVIYESSTLMHVYAVLIKLFGYSLVVLRLAALGIFLTFMGVQYVMLRRMFSQAFAVMICLFYCLPLGHTLIVSLNLSGDFPSILLLGSLILYLVYLVSRYDREALLPALGFVMGLAFWVHQMTVSFIITAVILLVFKFRWRIKKYLLVAGYAVIGGFPVVLSEIMTNFSLVKFLISGKFGRLDFMARLERSIDMLTYMVSRHGHDIRYAFLILLLLSIIALGIVSLRQKKFFPQGVFLLFFVVFFIIYFLSKFSTGYILSVRYFYPLYCILPVLLLSFLLLNKDRTKYITGGLFLLILLAVNNLTGYFQDISQVRQADARLEETVQAMLETGETYWMGDFWDSFVVTTISGEKISASENVNLGHYPPYALFYHNKGKNNNFVFLNEIGVYSLAYREMQELIAGNLKNKLEKAGEFIHFLERNHIPFQQKRVGNNLLVYAIQEDIPPAVWNIPFPDKVPELGLHKTEYSGGWLHLTFRQLQAPEVYGYRVHVEIPGYSSVIKPVTPDNPEILVRIACPVAEPQHFQYYFDYRGIKLPLTVQQLPWPLSEEDQKQKRRRILILSGLGLTANISGEKYRICAQEVNIEANISRIGQPPQIILHLYSPFNFSNPSWYRRFQQVIKVDVNGQFLLEQPLRDGKNRIELSRLTPYLHESGRNLIRLRFKYHLPFSFLPDYKTAALWERIELK